MGLFNPIDNLFQNNPNPSGIWSMGSLISFSYPHSQAKEPYYINDPQPLLIVTKVIPNPSQPFIVMGVNLHYLTFPFIKKILNQNKMAPYSYLNVKADKPIADAFRMYYRRGMMNIQLMDIDFLLRMMNMVRSFSENEIETVKKQISNQIRSHLQMTANQLQELNNPVNNIQEVQSPNFIQPQGNMNG